jgi:hypothetical protein
MPFKMTTFIFRSGVYNAGLALTLTFPPVYRWLGLKEGETLTFAYLPGKGTTLQVGNKELGTFESKGFADAILSIWLGTKPPSEDLKKGMLG